MNEKNCLCEKGKIERMNELKAEIIAEKHLTHTHTYINNNNSSSSVSSCLRICALNKNQFIHEFQIGDCWTLRTMASNRWHFISRSLSLISFNWLYIHAEILIYSPIFYAHIPTQAKSNGSVEIFNICVKTNAFICSFIPSFVSNVIRYIYFFSPFHNCVFLLHNCKEKSHSLYVRRIYDYYLCVLLHNCPYWT